MYIVYWSATGNTEAMANAVCEGAGDQAKLVTFSDVTVADLKSEDKFALGCPAMGAEELEEGDVEPFVAELEGCCSGKKIALFGSYDWGDGEWMRIWKDRMEAAGAIVISEPVICNNEPDDDGVATCKALGEALLNA